MDKKELEAKIAEVKAKLDADTEHNALVSELHSLEHEYGMIRAEELLPELVKKHINAFFIDLDGDSYTLEVFKSYDDRISPESIRNIVESDWPKSQYEDIINEMYDPDADDRIDGLVNAIRTDLDDMGIDYSGLDEHFIEDYIRNNLTLEYPDLTDQEVNVNIIMDTGDANYEYTVNSQYPGTAYNAVRPAQPGEEGYVPYDLDEILPPYAGIVWLAESQGHTREELHQALLNDNIIPEETRKQLCSLKEPTPKLTFLQSMYWEMANCPSSTPCVTFLVRMTLGNLIKLNQLINLQKKDGVKWDARKNPECGTLVLGKDTMTGLFDMISGGGSVLEVQLEKDVEIPIRFIRSATPDINDCCGIKWCVGDVYGLCGDAWHDTVKEIKEPVTAEENH